MTDDPEFERGTTPKRIEWVEETTIGETPSNPDWNLYSDAVDGTLDVEPDVNVERLDTVGDPDAQGHFTGPENSEGSITYSLQQWFIDGGGNAQDAAYYAMARSSDNALIGTHSYVERSEHDTGGADGAGRRIYLVGKGGRPSEVTVPFTTDDGLPVQVELSYQFDKVRLYDISQPNASTTLDITNNGSTSVDVTIEDEGASTTETNTVANGATVTTTESFGDIDAIELNTDTDGDVVVTDGSGTTLATISGSQNYADGNGDLGVPALGSGSHASALGSDYVIFNDDTLDYTSGNIASEVISGELTVSQGLDDNSQTGTSRLNIHPTNREVTWNVDVAGEAMVVDQVMDHLQGNTSDIRWTADEGTITGPNAQITSPGTTQKEQGNGKKVSGIELMSEGVTIA